MRRRELRKYFLKEKNMKKTPSHHGEEWTNADIHKLERLAGGNTPTELIAWELGRTEGAVRSKASDEDISLKPTNQSPYNRRKGK